jgi:hypothetical protein
MGKLRIIRFIIEFFPFISRISNNDITNTSTLFYNLDIIHGSNSSDWLDRFNLELDLENYLKLRIVYVRF